MPFKCPKCGKQEFEADQTIYEKQAIHLEYDPQTHSEYFMWGEPVFCETLSINNIKCTNADCFYELDAEEREALLKEIS